MFSLQAHPTQGAQFADDSTPPALDAIEGFGSLGFGTPGFNPGCAGPSWTEGNGIFGGEEFPEDGPVGIADPELKAIRRDVHGDTLNVQPESDTFFGFVYFKTHRHQVGPHDPNNFDLPPSIFLDPDLAALISDLLPEGPQTFLSRVYPGFTEADTSMVTAYGRRVGLPDLTRNFVIHYASETLSDRQVAALIRAQPAVLWAETAFGIFEDAVPNDPKFAAGEQHHLERIGLGLSDGSNWSRLQQPTPPWRIAVVDNGLRVSHEDLGGAAGPGHKVRSAFNYVAGLENSGEPCDRDHGTACAGIIAALTNNQTGVAAPAGGWSGETLGPELVSLAINCETNTRRDYRAQAIVDATSTALPGPSHQPAACGVVSMSNGNDEWVETEREAWLVAYLRDAVLVATKGNHDQERRRYPADYDPQWVISVGASRRLQDVRVTKLNSDANWGSNYGYGIDLVAPGENIPTTSHVGDNQYALFSGTSAAAPIVAAAAAGLRMASEERLSCEDVQGLLKSGCVDILTDEMQMAGSDLTGPDWFTGHGRLDLGASLALLGPLNSLVELQTIPAANEWDSDGPYPTLFVDGARDLPFPEGVHSAIRYRITQWIDYPTAFASRPSVWAVGSRSTGVSGSVPCYGDGYARINQFDNVGFEVVTWSYYVDIPGVWSGYWPAHPNQIVMGVSAVGPLVASATESATATGEASLRVLNSPGPTLTFVIGSHARRDHPLQIIDASGRTVRSLLLPAPSGAPTIAWDGMDDRGHACSSGVYWAVIGDESGVAQSARCVLVR
ncbi:MAG: S8 family serine peptidase [Candidatus Eisenbacteria bacterium]|nr:S8 family serine peptidase [Candidatus Eisenbacteria bacterium]